MFKILIHADARSDLEELWLRAPVAASRIEVLLQELQSSQDLLDALTIHDYGARGTEEFHVSKWQELWNKNIDLWRLKVWDLETKASLRYRVIYAYEVRLQRYHVLGIVHRSFNYDPNHEITKRIRVAYDKL